MGAEVPKWDRELRLAKEVSVQISEFSHEKAFPENGEENGGKDE